MLLKQKNGMITWLKFQDYLRLKVQSDHIPRFFYVSVHEYQTHFERSFAKKGHLPQNHHVSCFNCKPTRFNQNRCVNQLFNNFINGNSFRIIVKKLATSHSNKMRKIVQSTIKQCIKTFFYEVNKLYCLSCKIDRQMECYNCNEKIVLGHRNKRDLTEIRRVICL